MPGPTELDQLLSCGKQSAGPHARFSVEAVAMTDPANAMTRESTSKHVARFVTTPRLRRWRGPKSPTLEIALVTFPNAGPGEGAFAQPSSSASPMRSPSGPRM
jgi:hypothetical protein